MGNHLHMLIVVENPDMAPKFVGYFKRETAYAINGFLGRRKHTVWCKGYDSPILLDYPMAIQRAVYLYTNPQKANLVDKIEHYPNLSSWSYFVNGGGRIETKRIPRTAYSPLSTKDLTPSEQAHIARYLRKRGKEECALIITPNAWISCFEESQKEGAKRVNRRIIDKIREEEAELRKTRKGSVLGAKALRLQNFRKRYTPSKFGKRMICLSTNAGYRKTYIKWAQNLFSERDTKGHKHPPGLFAPGGYLLCNLVPAFVPIVGAVFYYCK